MKNTLNLYQKQLKIYESLYNENTINHILNITEDFLCNPIFILDTSYRVIARSNLAKLDNSGIEKYNDKEYLLLKNIRLMKENKCIDTIYNSNRAFFHLVDDHLIFCSIKINTLTVSYICILEKNAPFVEEHLQLVNTLSEVIAIFLQKENSFISESGLEEEYYLRDLLANGVNSIEHTKKRLENCNFSLNKYFLMLAIPFNQQFHDYRHNFALKQLIYSLKIIMGNCISTYYNDMIIFLVSNNNDNVLSSHMNCALIEFLNLNNLSCALSLVFENILYVKDFFFQCKYTLNFSSKNKTNNKLYAFEDFIDYYLFYAAETREHNFYKLSLSSLIHPLITKLLCYDKEHNSNLFETLRVYFEHNKSANKASTALNIHRSTFFYRFNKLQEILNMSLKDNTQLFKLELSLKILAYNNFNIK